MKYALTTIKPRRRPSWLGWLIILFLVVGLFVRFFTGLYPFLSPEKEPQKGLMVVEGWIHDFALDEAIMKFKQGGYSAIVCTGVPIETGSYIQQFKSYPEMTADRLKKMGIPPEKIIVAIADDGKRDRTYASAVALREAFMAYNIDETNLHLITTGPHGRRSRMLFKKALGKEYTIGVSSLEPASYEADKWYTCSEGVRSVMSEFFAYVYAKFFFYP